MHLIDQECQTYGLQSHMIWVVGHWTKCIHIQYRGVVPHGPTLHADSRSGLYQAMPKPARKASLVGHCMQGASQTDSIWFRQYEQPVQPRTARVACTRACCACSTQDQQRTWAACTMLVGPNTEHCTRRRGIGCMWCPGPTPCAAFHAHHNPWTAGMYRKLYSMCPASSRASLCSMQCVSWSQCHGYYTGSQSRSSLQTSPEIFIWLVGPDELDIPVSD